MEKKLKKTANKVFDLMILLMTKTLEGEKKKPQTRETKKAISLATAALEDAQYCKTEFKQL